MSNDGLHPEIPEDGSHSTIARWIMRDLKPASVLDYGCNDGRLLSRLYEKHGLSWSSMAGIDVPGMGAKFKGPRKVFWVPNLHPFQEGAFELVTCLEVAEHISDSHADFLVDEVSKLAEKHVLWSAATPGQGGWGHVNEQPHEYWLRKFFMRGWAKADFVGVRIAEEGPLAWWYAKNAYLLSR